MLRFRVGNKQQQQQYNITTFELKLSFIAMMLPVISKVQNRKTRAYCTFKQWY